MGIEQFKGARVLVVDDEQVVLQLVSRLLSDAGLTLVLAGSCAEAVAAIQKEEPAVAILDKNLPDGSGLDVLRQLKEKWPHCEALLFTGYPSFESVVDALRGGASDYMSKPLRDVAELRHRVNQALERRQLLTERVHTLQELQKAYDLQKLAAHSEMMAQLGRMLAGIVHELRTPLTYMTLSISYLRQLLEQGAPAGEREFKALDDLLGGTERIRRLVEDMSRVTAVNAYDRSKVVEIELAQIIDSSVKLTAPELKNKTEVVVRQADALRIHAAPVRLTQVFVNLLLNASQVAKTQGKVEVRTERRGDKAHIEVEDWGPGMPEEVRSRIFEPFFTTREAGTGLGLALAQEIIREHGGTIAVRSEVGKGTCFTIEIPLDGGAPKG